jgi:hypothetical protein
MIDAPLTNVVGAEFCPNHEPLALAALLTSSEETPVNNKENKFKAWTLLHPEVFRIG